MSVLRSPFRQARICACGDHGFVGLTVGRTALFDVADFDLIASAKWSLAAGRYAKSRLGFMHRTILKPEPQQYTDHINHDTLDNRRRNLRACTPAQNAWNSRTQHPLPRGVTQTANGTYRVSITANGKVYPFGRHKTLKKASAVAEAAIRLLHGEFAYRAEDVA